MCCNSGKVQLPQMQPIHTTIKNLLIGRDLLSDEFRTMIRLYNSILSFTSIKASVDEKLANNKVGNYTYKISGAVHHCIGNLRPEDKDTPKFAQIYIYDQSLQTNFRKKIAPTAKAEILNIIQE